MEILSQGKSFHLDHCLDAHNLTMGSLRCTFGNHGCKLKFLRKYLVDQLGCGPLIISFPPSFQRVFRDECKFKETLLPNNYNAYESSIYKGFYIALSKHGRLKRGYKATPAMTVTHFLPRLWARLAITHSFLHMMDVLAGNLYIRTRHEKWTAIKRYKTRTYSIYSR